MQRAASYSIPRRTLQVLTCAAALTFVACDNDVNFTPTAPTLGDLAPVAAGRSLEISGSLAAMQGLCLEATILYDGQELAAARTRCPEPRGCATLELNAVAQTSAGNHRIAFKVLRQSPEAVSYVANGQVLVSRPRLLSEVPILLEPRSATLGPGESVIYDINFWN